MKAILSRNTWSGSTWTNGNVYSIKTNEQEENGTIYTITADFRKYNTLEDSIQDHSAYLLGAKDGYGNPRYKGIATEKDYKNAAKIIHSGGYATSLTYADKLIEIVEAYDLTRFDLK